MNPTYQPNSWLAQQANRFAPALFFIGLVLLWGTYLSCWRCTQLYFAIALGYFYGLF